MAYSYSTAHFNPRSPHGERQKLTSQFKWGLPISTHAPRTGSDTSHRFGLVRRIISTHAPRTGSDRLYLWQEMTAGFQPTLPARGATNIRRCGAAIKFISTHAPRTGSDVGVIGVPCASIVFQPTLPARGATPSFARLARNPWDFNPRSPHGERHRHHPRRGRLPHFNPRSPHGERHATARRGTPHSFHFNPRSPHGERPFCVIISVGARVFQPTLPARGATLTSDNIIHSLCVFQPTLPARGATRAKFASQSRSRFQPTLPARGATGAEVCPAPAADISTHAPRTGSDNGS